MMIRRPAPSRLLLLSALSLLLATPAVAKNLSAPAVAQEPASWVTADDYPAAALRAGAAGVSVLRWDVTAEGTAENCTIVQSSGSPDLDQAGCTAILNRAHYTPALDRQGRPIRSAAGRRIRWEVPVEQPDTTVPYTLRPF